MITSSMLRALLYYAIASAYSQSIAVKVMLPDGQTQCDIADFDTTTTDAQLTITLACPSTD